MNRILILFISLLFVSKLSSQSCECPYPILLLHGYTGDSGTFIDTYTDSDFINVYGSRVDVFHAVINAVSSTNIWGADGIEGTADDDVLFSFNNHSNTLAAGCVYSMNFRNWWNQDPLNPQIIINGCSSPGFFDSDSNESAIVKQGYALGKMIDAVLNANPDKEKVIVIGHSMGGLEAREYLQRTSSNWVDPFAADGHKLKKLVTAVTPHGGSNTGSLLKEEEEPGHQQMTKDGTIDINSDAVRDLRYNYGTFSNVAAPYLYGGDEDDVPTFLSFHNSDVNCNGIDNDNNIVGINAAGSPNVWDGTTYNPALPLPTDIRYTYITSNWVFGGDGVVDIDRQWLYTGPTPTPTDGVAHRMTDTLLTNFFHSNVDGDLNTIVRALDEGDYPYYAWDVKTDNLLSYAVVPHKRSTQAPDGTNAQDPDWFKFEIPNGFTDSICISLTPNNLNAGKLEYFNTTPGDYATLSMAGSTINNFIAGGAITEINLGPADYSSGTNYFRVVSESISSADWKDPHKVSITSKLVVPVEWLSFEGKIQDENVLLKWSTAMELNNDYYEIMRSSNGVEYQTIARQEGSGSVNRMSNYDYTDYRPIKGVNFYKIRQVDYDGSYDETHVIKVIMNDRNNDIGIFPNPASQVINIDYKLDESLYFEISDALGKVLINGKLFPGLNSISIEKLPSATYTLRTLDQDHKTTTSKRFSKI